MRVPQRWTTVVATLALVAAAAAGCGGDADDAGTTATGPADATSTATATAPATVTVTLWFADADGRLRTERRAVPAGDDRLRAALDALAAGPTDPALLPALPAGTRVLGASSDGAVATVDLSAAFTSGYPPGGAAAELAIVGPLVRTAAAASGAPRVLVRVEGRTPVPTGSQFDFSVPFSPGDLPAP
jgi:spore germination protein GerM